MPLPDWEFHGIGYACDWLLPMHSRPWSRGREPPFELKPGVKRDTRSDKRAAEIGRADS